MVRIRVEDRDRVNVQAFVDLLQKQRSIYREIADLRKKGDRHTARERKTMLSALNRMEMNEAHFAELLGKGDEFKAIRLVQLRLLRDLSKMNAGKSKK